jgi:hypothetical protein
MQVSLLAQVSGFFVFVGVPRAIPPWGSSLRKICSKTAAIAKTSLVKLHPGAARARVQAQLNSVTGFLLACRLSVAEVLPEVFWQSDSA